MTPPGTVGREGERFAPTRWSVVINAARGDDDPQAAAAALSALCEIYWTPLYAFVRAQGHSSHDAQDLTQGFFAHLIERRIYERTSQEKGKFRAFLLTAIKNYLADTFDRERTLKRGGGRVALPLDEARVQEAESLFQTGAGGELTTERIDRAFEVGWAQALVNAALARVAVEYRAEKKSRLFDAVRAYIAGGAEPLPTYEELGEALRMPSSTLRSHVTRLRARYREALLWEVRRTVDTEAQARDELRELRRVLLDR